MIINVCMGGNVIIYNRVILLSLNNTVEFFKLSITIIKLLLIKTERFDPKVFFNSIQKTKPNSLFIYGQITSDDIMTVQRVRTMMVQEYKG